MGNTFSSKVGVRNALTEPDLRLAVKRDSKDAACSSSAVATSSGLHPTHSGLANWRGHVWFRAAQPRQKSCFRASEQALKRSCPRKEAYANIYNKLGAMGNTSSSKVVVRNALTDPHSSIAVKGDTKDAACSSPAAGTSSGLRPTDSGQANRREREWRSMMLSWWKSCFRASKHALKRSCLRKKPTQTSATILAFRETLFRLKLSPEMHLRTLTRVSL